MFNQGSYIDAKENIYAGYAQITSKIGKWGFLAGVRVEATNADYGGFLQTTNPDGSTTNVLTFRPVSYVNAFPTVQVRYDFTPTLLLRATYSTGIGRPGFIQNTTAASIDRTASPLLITRGNPNLQPTLGNNFDLSLEDYFADGGILSIALFDKEFKNYIADRIYNTTTDPLAPGQLATVTTFLNIPSSLRPRHSARRPPEVRLAAQAVRRLRHRGQPHTRRLAFPGIRRRHARRNSGRDQSHQRIRRAARHLRGDLEPRRLLRGLQR